MFKLFVLDVVEKSMFRFSFVVVGLLSSVLLFAQNSEDIREVSGRIVDFLTNEPIDSVQSDLLDSDSVLVTKGFTYSNIQGYRKKTYFYFAINKPGNYIMRFSHPDYDTYYQPITVRFYKRERSINAGTIPLKRFRNIQLNEVVIQKTKVKFYFKKDTLVYNADAFLTQSGFVLNEILKKMPGIVIKPDGEIEANGRKVQALLLNGKDFFNSDRKTLLENMPAYMVKDVRFYDKNKDSLSLIKREREFSGYVMDVKLKKEYQSFKLGNVDLGYGTSNRYYSKLFGLKYNSISKVYAYATANNINKDETISENGLASNHSNGDGDLKNAKVNLSYAFDHIKGQYALKGDAMINYRDAFTETQTLSQTFFTDGNVYSRQMNQTNTYLFTAKTDHSWYFFGNTPWDFSFTPSLVYEKSKGNNVNIQSSFNKDITDLWGNSWIDSLRSEQLTQAMEMYGISRQALQNKSDAYALLSNFGLSKTLIIPHTEDILLLNAKYKYHKISSKQFSKNDIMYKVTTWNKSLNKYVDMESNDHQINMNVAYTYKLTDYGSLTMLYDYDHTSKVNKNPIYSLHELEGWDSKSKFGLLPSQEELLRIVDSNNSYSYTQKNDVHKVELGYQYSNITEHKRKEFSLKVPCIIEERQLDFSQQLNDTTIRKRKFSPLFSFNYSNQIITHDHSVYFYSVQYDYQNIMPSLYNLLNIRNDVNPLNVVNGNPNLKNMQRHEVFGQLFWQSPRFYIHRMNFSYDRTNNQIANSIIYNRQNGITYITPCNVNGNWAFSLNFVNSLYVKRNRMISFNNDIRLAWQNCADYISADATMLDVKRIVKNFTVTERLHFTCSTNNTKYSMNGYVYVNYSKATSKQENFVNKDILNYGLQCNLSVELPCNFLMKSNLLSVCRHGYNFSGMDDEEYIWSVNVIKKYGEKYSINLELYDILGQRKNVYHYLNAQGCSDIFYNNMKRYMMLHFTYRF